MIPPDTESPQMKQDKPSSSVVEQINRTLFVKEINTVETDPTNPRQHSNGEKEDDGPKGNPHDPTAPSASPPPRNPAWANLSISGVRNKPLQWTMLDNDDGAVSPNCT